MGAPWSGGLIRQVISLTGPRIEGSKQTVSSSFFIIIVNVNVPRANSSEEMRVKEQVVHLGRRKAGAAKAKAEAATIRFESGMVTKKAFGSVRFEDD